MSIVMNGWMSPLEPSRGVCAVLCVVRCVGCVYICVVDAAIIFDDCWIEKGIFICKFDDFRGFWLLLILVSLLRNWGLIF